MNKPEPGSLLATIHEIGRLSGTDAKRIETPIICAGTDTQPACAHFKGGDCQHPENMRFDYVRTGKTVARTSADFRREPGQACGPLAWQYVKPEKGEPWPA